MVNDLQDWFVPLQDYMIYKYSCRSPVVKTGVCYTVVPQSHGKPLAGIDASDTPASQESLVVVAGLGMLMAGTKQRQLPLLGIELH